MIFLQNLDADVLHPWKEAVWEALDTVHGLSWYTLINLKSLEQEPPILAAELGSEQMPQ